MTSTGDDNLLSPEDKGDLEYRKAQLKRLQTEVVDLEDMGTGVSITDLGLNEFRMELMEYAKEHPELETCPGGISDVTAATSDAPAGVIFILKNVHNEVNIDNRNRLHPYYLIYLTEDGITIHDHLSPKDTLTLCDSCVVARINRLRNYIVHLIRRPMTERIWPFTPAC